MKRVLVGLGVFAAGLAHAEPQGAVRVGDHPGFGRVVFDMPGPTSFQLAERPGRVVLTFSAGGAVATPESVPHNVISVLGGDGSATLAIVPGARVRAAQMGNRIVVDVLDPAPRFRTAAPAAAVISPAAAPAAAPVSPATVAPAAATPNPAVSPATAAAPVAPASEPAHAVPPAAAPASAPVPAANPAPVEEVKLAQPQADAPAPAFKETVVHVPAAATVGAAAFRRGDLGVVVFDERVAIDPVKLEHVFGFSDANVREVGKGTMLVVPMAGEGALSLTREPAGWAVKTGTAAVPAADQVAVPDGIGFPFGQAGRVMTIRDPYTRQTLLIGTSKTGAPAGRAVATERRAPGYALLPTWLGLALEPSSDRVALRASLTGFTLVTPDRDSPARTAAFVPDAPLGLPIAPVPVLRRQLRAQIADAASQPPMGRRRDRVAAARTMLSLGMASEAQALLALAAEEDPATAADPAVGALAGMAAILAGRPAEAAGLDRLPTRDTNDVVLWRGLRDTANGQAAEGIGRAVSDALSYPSAIRDRILPQVVEAAVRDGQSPLADERLAKLPGLDYARGLQAERDGHADEALAAYDALDQGRDTSESVRGAIAAAELRLSTGKMSAGDAAEILERQTLRWRGDTRELAGRLRAAELRVRAGQWRMALESLRETEKLFPNAKSDFGARKAGVFKAMAEAKDRVDPIEMVTLAGDFADSMPGGTDGEAVAALLAEKLTALDLPSRAVPVLQRLLAGAKTDRAKAEYALALAQLHLDLGEASKAETVLNAVAGADLSPDRAEMRAVLLARARAGQGDAAGAAQILSGLTSPAADELRASMAAQAGDWQGSLRALDALASKLVPSDGELNDKQQDIVFRQAVAAVQAGDNVALRKLRSLEPKITGAKADQFRVLTASAVQSTDDLPRAASELAMSRSFSARLDANKAR